MNAFNTVLARAGATLPKRDDVDRRVIESVRTSHFATENGIVNDHREVGGYPRYGFSREDVAADSDRDGMPDVWETQYQLDPAQTGDGSQDADGDGYTNVEEYLNGTSPREKVDYTNLGNNVDTIS